MQKSGFFNALLNNGEYDRKYNANDYCDNLAVVISNGVLRSGADDLKVTGNGMVATVGVGRAWIEGHYYVNDTALSFAAVSAPSGGARYDRVILRLDKSVAVRSVTLMYVQGTAANNPTKPAPVRSGNVYDLVLADIYIPAGASSIQVTDTRSDNDVCGWVYSTSGDNSFFASLDAAFNAWFAEKKDTLSSVSLFKRYNWRTVLATATKTVIFDIPQYNAETCFYEVFINGAVKTDGEDYTVSGSVLTFTGTLVANTEVEVKVYKSLDGTGIQSVSDEITELQNAIATLNVAGEYNYICNGVNDNVKISEIAQAWLNGGTDTGSIVIRVFGEFGCTAAYSGSGTTANPNRWFTVGTDGNTGRRLVIDFSSCGQINLPIAAGTFNNIFHGHNVHIVGANVTAYQTAPDTVIRGFNSASGAIYAENCRFWLRAYKDSRIGQTGTFVNCRASVENVTNNSYCFLPFGDSLLRIIGGEYYAYTGASTAQSAILGQSAANSVSILYGVNAPTVEKAGYYQTNSILQWTGGGILNCNDLISALPLIVTAGISNIHGTIAASKPGLM